MPAEQLQLLGCDESLAAAQLPPVGVLLDIVQELQARVPNGASVPILENASKLGERSLLGPCIEVDLSTLERTSYVLSQKQRGKPQYISVCGRREYGVRKGRKSIRSKQPWPRTVRTDRLRIVRLHRWITHAVHGEPRSDDCEADHLCGNCACIRSAHLRWATHAANVSQRTARSPAESALTETRSRRHRSKTITW